MKILFHILHPAHVHFFKNLINILKENGYQIKIIAREKDVAINLLQSFGFEYDIVGKQNNGFFGLIIETLYTFNKVAKYIKDFKPDLIVSIGGFLNVVPASFLKKKAIFFTDHEPTITNALSKPFAEYVVTPSCFINDLGKKQIRYPGYHELAYLHPNRFKPNKDILKLLNVNESEKYVIIRFVSWNATHDKGHKGFSNEMKLKAVKEFSKYAKVFITSEKELTGELEKFRIAIPIEKMHDAIYYSDLLFGESATMASEAAVLGVPAIYLDFVGRGYTNEQEKKYGLVFNFKNSADEQEKAIKKGIELLSSNETKNIWAKKREIMLKDKIDVTQFMVDFIENIIRTN